MHETVKNLLKINRTRSKFSTNYPKIIAVSKTFKIASCPLIEYGF